MDEIVIEKDIPVPRGRYSGKHSNIIQALATMDLKDSFVISSDATLYNSLRQILLRNTKDGRKFITRRISDTERRVWRVE